LSRSAPKIAGRSMKRAGCASSSTIVDIMFMELHLDLDFILHMVYVKYNMAKQLGSGFD
jgi:hypothetical protein